MPFKARQIAGYRPPAPEPGPLPDIEREPAPEPDVEFLAELERRRVEREGKQEEEEG